MQDLDKALADIVAIRSQIARDTAFRGLGAATVAGTGFLALACAAGQALWLGDPAARPGLFFGLWIAAALAAFMMIGVEVAERIPDKMLKLADEVVNIDLTADDLITRLKEGKIYTPDKVAIALRNFFKSDSILQLRELALKEVAGQIERKVETEVPRGAAYRHEHILTCISSNQTAALNLIRKCARLAGYYNAQWTVLYVETPRENPDRVPLDRQRHLINNFRLATELGARIERIRANSIARCIAKFAEEHEITTVCIGKPRLTLLSVIIATSIFDSLLKRLTRTGTDLIIIS